MGKTKRIKFFMGTEPAPLDDWLAASGMREEDASFSFLTICQPCHVGEQSNAESKRKRTFCVWTGRKDAIKTGGQNPGVSLAWGTLQKVYIYIQQIQGTVASNNPTTLGNSLFCISCQTNPPEGRESWTRGSSIGGLVFVLNKRKEHTHTYTQRTHTHRVKKPP